MAYFAIDPSQTQCLAAAFKLEEKEIERSHRAKSSGRYKNGHLHPQLPGKVAAYFKAKMFRYRRSINLSIDCFQGTAQGMIKDRVLHNNAG